MGDMQLECREVLLEKKIYVFLNQDVYLSKRQVKLFLDKYFYLIEAIKKQVLYSDLTTKILMLVDQLEEMVEEHNASFLNRKLREEKEYFDHMFDGIDDSVFLDEEQRRAILTDEDYVMVIAGAGSGKTTTMAAKVKYLVERQHVSPHQIMMISYTNKAVEELKEKINKKFKIPVHICTFHKFGMDILKKQKGELRPLITGYNIVSDYFEKVLCEDNEKLKDFLVFFNYYFDIPTGALSFKSINEYHRYRSRVDFISLKSRIGEYNQSIIDKRLKEPTTIQREFLRSSEEVMIANFLYMNGIEYAYEKPYPYLHKNKVYLPDFTIYYGEKTYYLEHFGIKENGGNAYYTRRQNALYRRQIHFKRRIHKTHQTDLIETYSVYQDGRSLLEHLREELDKRGILCAPKDEKEVYMKLRETGKDVYYMRFISFCLDFLRGFKTKGYQKKDFSYLRDVYQDNERIVLFLNFMEPLYDYYQRELAIMGKIDFEDMINESCSFLESASKEEVVLPYQYIIIDEYQDISMQRANLTKAVSKLSDAKVIAVGDDWQAIFAFAGSDVSLFTQFKEWMGYGKELQITTTYRNSQELIDVAGSFVMKNQEQIVKRLRSAKHISKPVVLMAYDDAVLKLTRRIDAIKCCIEEIVATYSTSKNILLIGRYSFDKYHLLKDEDFYEIHQDQIRYKVYPELEITFLTAHSSKGLGFDNVIIINGSDGTYGFPSQLKNDEIMNIIEVQDLSYAFAEERRLFYVALTRTKNKVYIVMPASHPSSFLLELQEYEEVIVKGEGGTSFCQDMTCPICHFPLIRRKSPVIPVYPLYVCSNEKELCHFKTNHLRYKREITRCPRCRDGYLIVKKRKDNGGYFIGCTNYKKGCEYTEYLS